MYKQLYQGEQFEATKKTLLFMHKISKQNGVPFQIILYPLMAFDKTYLFEQEHELLLAFCQENGINCIDGAQAFKEFSSSKNLIVHPTDLHPNAQAQKLLADYLIHNKLLIFQP